LRGLLLVKNDSAALRFITGPKYRITLVKEVQEKLKVKVGDMIA
jgi:hypothetical protein